MTEGSESSDNALLQVAAAIREAPDVERRLAAIFRRTFDQLYDGQHTGRYSWSQLYKTEKTHYGTLVEINLRREFVGLIEDGLKLDFKIAGYEIDCKYSYQFGGWMLPPECFDELLLVCFADDQHSEWSLGLVRATARNRRTSSNRDGKTGLNVEGRSRIEWLFWGAEMPPNVLLQVDEATRASIYSHASGQARVNELFRLVLNRRIGRNTVATVAQQDDYMKRVRANGGARSALAPVGILIPGGDFESHREVARQLGAVVPDPGEFVSLQIARASVEDPYSVLLDGQLWRLAEPTDTSTLAPQLPQVANLRDWKRSQ